MKIYKAINAVQAALAKTGIAKDKRNSTQGYNFRGIDDVYLALSPLLAEHGLCILPRVLSRTVTERVTPKGGLLFYTAVEVEFDFVCVEDGSKHTVKTFGEAMDSGDKSTNKAMSAAYKYAAFQAFAIPTEGDNDADASTHEVVKGTPKAAAAHLPAYPNEQLAANLPNWQAAIDKGRTSNDILNLVSSKYTLTEHQKAQILSLKPTIKDPFVADMEAAETI